MSRTSASGNSARAAASSWAALSTSTTRTPEGGASETLAAIRVTSAPRLAASPASASPMRPEERLPT